ncbi:hypothetical protein L1887_17592 [Cichorium endivia]|nr:hypothetical protein L1887_17592 [Cichorium endivia]
MVDFGALVFFRYLTYEFSIQYKMLNEENVYFANGKSEIYVPQENDKDCTDDLDIQDERVNEENGNSEVHQNEENDKSCLIESDIQGESHNVGGESQLSNNFIGSNGSLVWIPQIDPKLIPVMNTIFNDLNDCINWYKAYAEKSGFDIRRSTERKTKSGITKAKYFICHRAGLPNTSKVDTISILHKKQARNTNCQRTQCQAFVAFKIIPEFDWNVPTREGEFKVEFNKEEITTRLLTKLFPLLINVYLHYKMMRRSWKNLSKKLEQLKIGVDEQTSDKLPTTKQGNIEKFYGVTIPEGVAVENPPIVRNKGSGTGKRLKSVLEKAIDQGQKKSRTCKRCGVQGHNSRSCSTSKNVSKE